jgi:hypothetical protein
LPVFLQRKVVDGGLPSWDISSLIGVMYHYWDLVFKKAAIGANPYLLNKIRCARNTWAHQDSFSSKDVYETLEHAARLLKAANAIVQAQKIEETKKEMWRRFDAKEQTAVRASEDSVDAEAAQLIDITLPACWQCGTALAAGKRFCVKCGQPVDRFVAGLPEEKDKAPDLDNNAPPIRTRATRTLWIAGAASILVLIGIGSAWYMHSHVVRRPTAPSTVSGEQLARRVARPSPAKTPQTASPDSAASGKMKTNNNQIRKAVPGHTSPSPESDLGKPTPEFHAPRAPTIPQSAGSHSGTLQYHGDPVPYGGSVTFDHLPKVRLKFLYDTTSWRMIIRLNPDGTKKVILNSIKPGLQTNCDLGWQVVD